MVLLGPGGTVAAPVGGSPRRAVVEASSVREQGDGPGWKLPRAASRALERSSRPEADQIFVAALEPTDGVEPADRFK